MTVYDEIVGQILDVLPSGPNAGRPRQAMGRVTPRGRAIDRDQEEYRRQQEEYAHHVVEQERQRVLMQLQQLANEAGDNGDVRLMNDMLQKYREIKNMSFEDLAWIVGQRR